MRTTHLAGILLLTIAGACGNQSERGGHSPVSTSSPGSRSIVGRWALDSLVKSGEDLTSSRVRGGGPVVYYSLNGDGTFRITHGDSVVETGTWSQDTTASPMIFDHVPDVDGKPGPWYVPGIFAITGDTLIVTITGPNPERRHPTQFHSSAADGSWLLVYHRVPR
jgi:uncharacterized protein (TIGR03067 family)